MPLLTLIPRDACNLCGCRLHGFTVGAYRINKNSMRSERGGLSWVECPECGPAFSRRHPLGTQPRCDVWRPDEKSRSVIDTHRERKGWA